MFIVLTIKLLWQAKKRSGHGDTFGDEGNEKLRSRARKRFQKIEG